MQANDASERFQHLCDFVIATSRSDIEGDLFDLLNHFLPKMMSADRSCVTRVNERHDEFDIITMTGAFTQLALGMTMPVHGTIVGRAFLENRPLLVNFSEHLDSLDAKMLYEEGVATGISCPLHVNGKPFGNINVASCTEGAYTESSVTMMLTIAALVSGLLGRKEFIEEARRSESRFFSYSKQLEALNIASLSLAKVSNVKDLFETISETIHEILPVHRMSYILPDLSRGVFAIKAFKGAGFPNDEMQEFPISGSLLEDSLKTGRPEYFPCLKSTNRRECERLVEIGMKSAWSVPIRAGDRITAIVTAATRSSIENESDLMSVLSILGGMMNVAMDRILAADALEFQAFHDTLTGLANRAHLNARLKELISGPDTIMHALLLIDLKRFKEINDFFGHVSGDQVLQKVARWLRSFAKPGDIVARLGGDEFAMLIVGGEQDDRIQKQLSGLLEKPQLDVSIQGRTITTQASIGIAFYPDDGTSVQQLMRHADLALHEAKKSRDETVFYFENQMVEVFERRINLLEEFRGALEASQIRPYYQPLVDLGSGKVGGLEALVRWDHPKLGELSPSSFQDVFDDRELCANLGREMLKQVTRDMGLWKISKVPFGKTGINFTDADFAQQGFTLNLMRELARNGLSASDIVVEVTENSILQDGNGYTLMQLQELRAAGIGVALDDFGTGYASLSHLSDVQFSSLKIDKSFTKKLAISQADLAIVEFLTNFGTEMGFVTIAEGIETDEELKIVKQLNCKYGQGYLFARPVPAVEVPEMIARLNGEKRAVARA